MENISSATQNCPNVDTIICSGWEEVKILSAFSYENNCTDKPCGMEVTSIVEDKEGWMERLTGIYYHEVMACLQM